MAQLIELNGVQKFEPRDDRTGQTWERWLKGFQLFVTGKGVTNDAQMTALLLHCAGSEVQDIFYTLPDRNPGALFTKSRKCKSWSYS